MIELSSWAEHIDSFPASVLIIAVVNPMLCPYLLDLSVTLSESVFQINLTTPYRSTIAITSLARFLAKSHVEYVPEGEFGTDVEEKKPIVFGVGSNKDKQIQVSLEVAGHSNCNPSSGITEECVVPKRQTLKSVVTLVMFWDQS